MGNRRTVRQFLARPRQDSLEVSSGQRNPTSLDNGRRSPKMLLRAVVARLLGRKA
jgi:hypothetical protein